MRVLIALVLASVLVASSNIASVAWSAEHAAPSIYKCEIEGVITFADRPCGGDAEPHRLGETVTNVYEAPPIAPSTSRSAKAPAKKPRIARTDRSEAKRAESCARIAQGLKEIRSKMRSGYTAKEGERLRERQVTLRARQREARCS